jgi:hypothetical protein
MWITQNTTDMSGSTITYNGFPAGRPASVTSDSSSKLILNTVSTTTDISGTNTNQSGFYLQSNFRYTINTGLLPSSSPYTLNAVQTFSDGSFNTMTPVKFYVDGLDTTTQTINGAKFENTSSATYVTGVPVVYNWQLKISDVSGTNNYYYFSSFPALTCSFGNAGQGAQNVVDYFTPPTGTGLLSSTTNTLVNSTGVTISGTHTTVNASGNITNTSFIPRLTVKSIRNTINTDFPAIRTFIDQPSVYAASQFKLITTEPTIPVGANTILGQLLNSPNFGIDSISPLSGTGMTTYLSGKQISYTSNSGHIDISGINHSALLTDSGNYNLQIVKGYFVTRATTDTSGVAYQNYEGYTPVGNNYPNYSNISGYRWATFGWVIPANINTLQLVINNFIGTLAPLTSNVEPYLQNMIVLYRFEDSRNKTVVNPPSTGNYSTTWINASYQISTTNQFASTYSSFNDNNLTYGGIKSLTLPTTAFTFASNTLTISNLICHIQSITTFTMNLYVSIGLHMKSNIGFKSVYCRTT